MNKLQKPMTLEEADYKWELITLEKKGEDKLLLGDMTGSVEDRLISFVYDDPHGPIGEELEKRDYGKSWRLWEHVPTHEERSAAGWSKH